MAYTPSASVKAIEERVVLTPSAVRIFHATAPVVASPEAFNEACPRQELSSPIVGCYTPQDAIYIFDVHNEDLDGIKDVTAVHELLHAVWQRMGSGERERIGGLLEDVHARYMADESLERRMEYYARTQEGQELNELHSILGTEFAELGDELEVHYAKYFDRKKVLALYDSYQEHYDSLRAKVERLQGELEELSSSVGAQNQAYERDARDLDADIRAFNARAQNGSFTGQSQFSAERRILESRVSTLESRRSAINDAIVQYNELYREYKQVAEEIQVLNNSIDSFKVLEESSSLQNL